MDKLLSLLNRVRPDLNFALEKRLVDDNVLDSFDVITIVSEINEEFGIEITVADLEPDNLNDVNAMLRLINQLKK